MLSSIRQLTTNSLPLPVGEVNGTNGPKSLSELSPADSPSAKKPQTSSMRKPISSEDLSILNLADDMQHKIFGELPTESKANVALVCKAFHKTLVDTEAPLTTALKDFRRRMLEAFNDKKITEKSLENLNEIFTGPLQLIDNAAPKASLSASSIDEISFIDKNKSIQQIKQACGIGLLNDLGLEAAFTRLLVAEHKKNGRITINVEVMELNEITNLLEWIKASEIKDLELHIDLSSNSNNPNFLFNLLSTLKNGLINRQDLGLSFDLAGIHVSHRDLKLLFDLQSLKKLNLSRCIQISDASIGRLVNHPNLQRLNLSGTGITDVGVEHLATLPNLQRLDLRDCKKVTDAGLSVLNKGVLVSR